jgi:hypothetical protein
VRAEAKRIVDKTRVATASVNKTARNKMRLHGLRATQRECLMRVIKRAARENPSN